MGEGFFLAADGVQEVRGLKNTCGLSMRGLFTGEVVLFSGQDIGSLFLGPWVVRDGEIEACEEQGPAKLPLFQYFGLSEVLSFYDPTIPVLGIEYPSERAATLWRLL